MTTLSYAAHPEKGAEPIAGYILQEQIGVGGYGEVWKATAPGGMSKALKLVFGRHDDARASRELKSLDRIKGLSHPFLISVERIEISNDTLIIVTELAQRNLKQRFLDSVRQGLEGIPRDELLSYMRDAADALDYLWKEESLQHLDIKPENVLLVGKHAKIGDFGLVKDLQDASASLVAGLTPQYSPPELFCNHPDRRSDQYSLAIVFQEMLTGKVPFDGRTPAALALQHVQAEPDLSGLPPSDRFAVGKALSKLPENRFGSCTEFVESLFKSAKSTVSYLGAGAKETKQPGKDNRLESLLRESNGRANDGHTLAVSQPRCQGLGPLRLESCSDYQPPTLFVGIGGFAGAVLADLRQRLDDRFGNLASVPAIQTLWLDTAPATFDAASAEQTRLPEVDTLILPLKTAQEYRRSAIDNLKSVSRRWIYNIPRSGSTEGFRPLGRLALLTYPDRILQQLRKRLRTITDAETIKQCKLTSRYAVTTSVPQVYVIASLNGGTGSGMLIDCGYAIRQVLAELCLSDEAVRCLLVNLPSEQASLRGLAIANAYSCLAELDYFSRSGTIYPGEPGVGLLGFQGSEGPFRDICVTDFGDAGEQSRSKFVGRVAEYLYLNVEPRASRFFQESRRVDNTESSNCRFRCRSFGVYSFNESQDALVTEFCELLCMQLVAGWLGKSLAHGEDRPRKLCELQDANVGEDEHSPRHQMLDAEVAGQLAAHDISDAGLQRKILERVAGVLGERADAYFRRIIEESLKSAQSTAPVHGVLTTIGLLCGERTEGSAKSRVESIPDAVGRQLESDAKALADGLSRWALSLVDEPSIRVEGAKYAVRRMIEKLAEIKRNAASIQQQQEAQLQNIRGVLYEQMARVNSKSVRSLQIREWVELLVEYSDARVKEVCAGLRVKVVGLVEASVNATADALRDMWRDLNALSALFRVPADLEALAARFEGELNTLWTQLMSLCGNLVQQLDRDVDVALVPPDSAHKASVFESVETQRGLVARMKSAARQVTLKAVRELQGKTIGQLVAKEQDGQGECLRKCLQSAGPGLAACGGGKRTLVVMPPGQASQQLVAGLIAATGDEPTLLEDADQNAVVCSEVSGLELKSIAQHLVGHRVEIADMAKRVHARLDVTFGA